MPTLQRIGSGGPGGSGGGGGPAPAGNLQWGPDFGEGSSGSDNKTHETGVNLDLDSAAIENQKTVGVDLTMPELAAENEDSVNAALDLDALAIENQKTVGANMNLDAIAMENEKSIGANINLDALAMENTKTVGAHLSGEVEGAPFWQDINVNSRTGVTSDLIMVSPASTQAGDLLLQFICVSDSVDDPDITTLTGWTLIRDDHVTVAGGGAVNMRVKSFWRTAPSAGSAVYTWAISPAANNCVGELHVIRGQDATTPIDAHAGATLLATALDPDPSAPAVTTVEDNCMVFAYLAHYHAATDQSHSSPANHEERNDSDSTSGVPAIFLGSVSATRVFATPGSQAAVEFNCTETVATDACMQRISIAPGTLVIAP